MIRPLWVVTLIRKIFPTIKFLSKLTNFPLIGNIVKIFLFKGDNSFYLLQDKVIPIDRTIETHDEYILPSQVLEYFIKKSRYIWKMNFCLCRSSIKCKDYPIDFGCLFLGEATLGINPQFGKHISEDEALEYLKECRKAGLIHFIGRNKLDSQWLGANPGDKLMTICNCCPCCCLWKNASIINPLISNKIQKMPGVTVEVNDNCIGCGTCIKVKCFVDAIQIKKGRSVISSECRGCGRCVSVCPNGAITLTINDKEYIKKTILSMSSVVDVT
ncbi:MAG: 4Fe-4S dicluster domain-containing protein [Promethearchaeota archaeon]